MNRLTVKCFTAIALGQAYTGVVREESKMVPDVTIRERAWGWLIASGIALAAVGLFLTAILLGAASV